METVTDFIFLCSKITTDCDYSHYIKRHLPLAKKAMTNLDSILKSRDFADKGPYSQSYGFSNGHELMLEIEENNRMGRMGLSSRKLETTREHFMQ